MEEISQILTIMGIGIPVLSGIGLFMIKKLIDLGERVSNLEGRHKEIDER